MLRIGYLVAYGKRHGIDVAFIWSESKRAADTTIPYDFFGTSTDGENHDSLNYGLIFGYGFSFSPFFSFGLTFQPFIRTWRERYEEVLRPTS